MAIFRVFAILLALLGSSSLYAFSPAANGYMPIAICNDQTVQFFQTFKNGAFLNEGIVAFQYENAALSLMATNSLAGSRVAGFAVETSNGRFLIDPTGRGQWLHQACTQVGNSVRCKQVTSWLNCIFPKPIPSGFSAGH